MSGRRILVTGASGFTGRHFIRHAAAHGYECHAMIQHRTNDIGGAIIEGAYAAVSGDLREPGQLDEIIAGCRPDYVVHLAAVSFVAHNDLNDMFTSNVAGTANLLDALTRAPHRITKTIVVSSANIYGNAQILPIDEETPARPQNDYAISKLAAEHVARIRMSRLPLLVVRPFNYTGAGQAEHFLIPKLVTAISERRRSVTLGNLEVARDFSDVRDVVSAYLQLLQSPASDQVFNVCSGTCVALHQIVDKLCDLADYRIEIETAPQLIRANEIKQLYGTDHKLASVIGKWRHHSFDDTLSWMMDHACGRTEEV